MQIGWKARPVRCKPAARIGANGDIALGICVLNWNAGTMLTECLRSIETASSNIPSRIVVVDNCSSDNSIALALHQFPSLQVIRNTSNLGYPAGNNVGALALLAEECNFLMFVNPDVVLDSRAIAAMLHCLLQNPQAGCAGGVPAESKGMSIAARTRPSILEKIVLYGPLHRLPFLRNKCADHVITVERLRAEAMVYAVLGACMVFRSNAFCEIGGFDDNTFLYEEEFIVAEKLRVHGWKSVVATEARYGHAVGLSTDQIPYRRRLHFIRSEQYLLRRYYGWNPLGAGLLRLYRYLEWVGYALGLFCRTCLGKRTREGVSMSGFNSLLPSKNGNPR